MSKSSASGGIGLGGLLAVILSWTVNHSIVWAILHFFCSWFYVIYWALEYSGRALK
jgi:p-aminobenzoyl-glutamate transporter AbgT